MKWLNKMLRKHGNRLYGSPAAVAPAAAASIGTWTWPATVPPILLRAIAGMASQHSSETRNPSRPPGGWCLSRSWLRTGTYVTNDGSGASLSSVVSCDVPSMAALVSQPPLSPCASRKHGRRRHLVLGHRCPPHQPIAHRKQPGANRGRRQRHRRPRPAAVWQSEAV